jgi:short-subunit dehydrogenase
MIWITVQTMMQTEFGPWAVITGASSGIGEAFARALAADGVHVVLAARRTERLAALGAELGRDHGVAHRVVTVDLADPDGPATLVEATAGLDVGLLVSNAGAGHPGRFVDQDLDDLHRRLRLNAVAHLDLAHAFARPLVARGRGGIVLVGALGASAGIPHMAHESGSKAYVDALGTALHQSWPAPESGSW